MKNPQFFVFSSIVIFVLSVTSLYLFLVANNILTKTPRLAKNLSNNFSEANTEFNKRVEESFPIGSSEKKLIQELDSQGFEPAWSYNNQHRAFFEKSNIACKLLWTITWQINEQGKLTRINANYRSHCL